MNETERFPYRVSAATSRTYDFAFASARFATMAEALSYAKAIAHRVKDIAPGTGGLLFPAVVGPYGEDVPYTITTY